MPRSSRLLAVLLLAAGCLQAQDTEPTSRPTSRATTHRISLRITWDGERIVDTTELVHSLDEVRGLVGTAGQGVSKRLERERSSGDLYPRILSVIDVSARFPLSWLQATVFGIESETTIAEVGQDQFVQSV